MKQFNWEEFLNKENKIAVHCKTEEEAKDFCRQMHEHGMKWYNSNKSYIERINWHVYKEKTCYTNNGSFCDKDYYIENDYTILEWSDYIDKEFTKADLRDGMVVENVSKTRYLFLGNRLLRMRFHDELNWYDDKLKNTVYEESTIKKVFIIKNDNVNSLEDIFLDKNLELIWERTETKHMTAEEMRQKLEELTGEKIEVEPSKNEMIGTIKIYCNGRSCKTCILNNECSVTNIYYMTKEQLKRCYKKVMEDG